VMLSNGQQLLSLFYCLGFGVWIGTLADAADLWPHRNTSPVARFLRDAAFAVSAGVLLFLLSLAITGGEIRPAMLLCVGIGIAVGHRTAGRLLRRIIPPIVRFIRQAASCFRHRTAVIGIFLQKTAKKAVFFSKKGLQTAFYMLYNKKRP